MTYDDDGFIENPVLFNKNVEITRLRQQVQALNTENDALLQRVKELEAVIELDFPGLVEVSKKAARYRWLKAQHNDWESSWRVYQPHPTLGSVAIDQGLTADLDDVIDAAMEADK